MEENFINILGADEIDTLFGSEETTEKETQLETGQKEEKPEDLEENGETTTTEAKGALFEGDSEPESVGSEDNQEGEKEGSAPDDGGGTSPNDNFYSSIANAMAEDGIFPNLDEETVAKADSAEALSDLIEAEVVARLDETQQRVAKALNNGVEPDSIRMYEGTLQRLQSIRDTDITAETPEAEQLRYQLITQDYLNNGYSREKADKMARRSIDAGNDIEDAKEALQSNRDYFQNKYNQVLDEAQKNAEKEKENRKKQSEKLKDSLLKDKTLLGDMEISQDLRKKAFECISKPVYKDPETGEYLTAVQKYEQEHPVEFIKYVGLFMALTNDFKDFESFTKGKVKKEVKKGMRALEQALNGTRRNSDGSLRMVTKASEDPESIIPSGFKLAL
jgi:hypothetical protein